MTAKLSVNINKVALIRNGRGGTIPNLVKFAQDCEEFGADGITVHPRPDERHIRYDDLQPLKEIVQTEFNIEGYPTEKFINHVLAVQPHQCTLVPDPPGVLTSDRGWDVTAQQEILGDVIPRLQEAGIRVSIFLDANVEDVKAAADTGTDRIEFYTGDYAKQYFTDQRDVILGQHVAAATEAYQLGIGVNAGHDLNLDNLKTYAQAMSYLKEVSIGHALISDALYYGISNVIGMYKHLLR